MKNLLVVSRETNIEEYINYINQTGYDLDIINSNEYSDSYQNLDKAIFLKQTKQLENLVNYKYCFFLDDQAEKIILPSSFKEVQYRNIMLTNPIKHTYYPEPIVSYSTKFWYCNSIDFDVVGKFWKSKIYSLDRYFREDNITMTNDKLDSRPYSIFFLYWLNQININTNSF